MLLTYRNEFARTIKRHRAEGWGWRYDGLDDWPTERIIDQLRQIGIDTDDRRFPQQADAAGRFTRLEAEWVQQIPEEKMETGFWADFPLVGIPVLWERLAPQIICADLISQHLHRVIKAEESGKKLPDVDGLPAGLAAALELARFLLVVEPSQRSARFNEVDEGGYYDYFDWLSGVIESRGPEFPDAVTQIADAMSDCCDGDLLQSDLAMALALAGRHEEAVSRVRANIECCPDHIWVRILAGDVFEELGDDDAAIRQWLEALEMACEHDDWSAAADRLEEAFDRAGRQTDFEKILSKHPDPDPKPKFDPEPAYSFSRFTWPVSSPSTMTNHLEADSVAVPDVGSTTRLARVPKIGRNEPCPCGSGKKYKKCCIS
jgi:tetratricopeptide (TPR) repeat protein